MRIIQAVVLSLSFVAVAVPAVAQDRSAPSDRRTDQVQMPRPGTVSFIGVRLADVSADDVKPLKLTKAEGAVVESINPNSPASTAGLRVKDVIVEFDGERVRSARHLTRLVAETPAGREVVMSVMRDGRKTDLHIKPEENSWFNPRMSDMMNTEEMRQLGQEIGRQAHDMSRNLPDLMAGAGFRGRLGVSAQELSPELAEYFGVKSGVLVASVQKESPADKAGLRAGDVITAVDGHAVTTSAELIHEIATNGDSHEVTLTVTRDKNEMKLKAVLMQSTQRPASRRGVSA
jgi:serine protease Do